MEYLSLKDHVYNYIVEQINSGKLLPGKKVNENHICEMLKVSRTPVREALIQLSSEGLLDNVPRKGFVIKSLTKQEAEETYFIITSNIFPTASSLLAKWQKQYGLLPLLLLQVLVQQPLAEEQTCVQNLIGLHQKNCQKREDLQHQLPSNLSSQYQQI